MNFKNYFDVIKTGKWLIIVMTILTAIFSLSLAHFLPRGFETNATYVLHRVNREKSPDFQYDNYYSVQASEYFSNSVVALLATPEVVFEIYKKAQLENEDSINNLVKSITAQQLASHVIKVKVTNRERQKSEKIMAALSEVIGEKVKQTELTSEGKNSFEISSGEKVVIEKKLDPKLAALCGLAGGIFIGLGFVFLKTYLKKEAV